MARSLTAIAADLDSLVAAREKAEAASVAAEQAFVEAQAAYAAVVSDMKTLDAEYQAAMKDIFSFGGTKLVA